VTTATVERVAVDTDVERTLRRLAARLEESRVQRDRLIYEAWKAGAGYRELARIVGLTHPAVMNIVTRQALEQDQIKMRKGQKLHPLDPGGGD
jgi:hypothetical protein